MTETLTIPARFNGPPESANGGYTCGRVAQLVDAEVVEVSLRAPPPLDTPLEIVHGDRRVELRDGETLVAEGKPAELLIDTPDALPQGEVAAAVERGREHWAAGHPFPTCVVCGPERDDGLGIVPGPIPGRDGLFGACWTPEEDAPELVWAALDCPTSGPVANDPDDPAFKPIVLARLAVRIDRPVVAGEPHVVLSWPLAVDGRKRQAAAALFTAGGEACAVSRALWIELRP